MIYLESGNIRLGILEDAGGRIVSLQKEGGRNLLKSDATLWNQEKPLPSPANLDFTGYNGHEVWAGPQSEWWKHQDLNQEKKASTLFWPPDPYITYGRYKVTRQSVNSITLEGENSPISGLKLTKQYVITSEGTVEISVEAENIRKKDISWDLWMLTRVDGNNPTFVPIESGKNIKVTEPTHEWEGSAPYQYGYGYFTFTPERRDMRKEACTAKAFLTPNEPFIATLSQGKLLVLRFEHHAQDKLHPEQTEVELYNYASADDSCLMEMEYHAPYMTLKPGEKMSTKETWQIYDYTGKTDRESLCKYLDAYIKIKDK